MNFLERIRYNNLVKILENRELQAKLGLINFQLRPSQQDNCLKSSLLELRFNWKQQCSTNFRTVETFMSVSNSTSYYFLFVVISKTNIPR